MSVQGQQVKPQAGLASGPDTGPETEAASPARKRRTHEERTQLSDQLMLDAARDMIIQIGTTETTLKAIGEQAGYSRGLANARFGSKDALFNRLSGRCRELWITELRKAQVEKVGADVILSRIDATIAFARHHPKDAKVMYILWFESVGVTSEMNKGLAAFHKAARADIQSLCIKAGLFEGDTQTDKAFAFAARFCGAIFGLCYQWLVNPEDVHFEQALLDFRAEITNQVTNQISA